MDRDSMQRIKLDVRLLRRRGWMKKDDIEKRLAELPDVAHKAAPPEVAPSGGER